MTRAKFIAGAVCRTCGAIDRILVEEFDGERRQRCVACGHEEAIVTATNSSETAVRVIDRVVAAGDAPVVPKRSAKDADGRRSSI